MFLWVDGAQLGGSHLASLTPLQFHDGWDCNYLKARTGLNVQDDYFTHMFGTSV